MSHSIDYDLKNIPESEDSKRKLTELEFQKMIEKLKKFDINDYVRKDAAMITVKKLQRLEKYLHEKELHPDYEYRTTEGQRKAWDGEPDLTKEGWEENKDCGINGGWERFEYTEERYWRRLKSPPVIQEEQGYVPD